MRNYDYIKKSKNLLTPEIVSLLTTIHEFKGEQTLFIEAHADKLTSLVTIAKIQSTDASNKIEGIYTSDERLKKIVQDKTMPKTRNEEEIAGYRDVLTTIHENYEYIPVKPSLILQLHRDLYKFNGIAIGGKYKFSDNVIAETDEQGHKRVRFEPVPSWETAESIDMMCKAYNQAINEKSIDPLLVLPMAVLDFLCIHPFEDGNGRMSRLLTLLMLYRNGYIVGKYISIEKLIEQSKETYYETLHESSLHWHEEENSYIPFVRYYLGIIAAAYRDFSSRVQVLAINGLSKPERIGEVIKSHIGKITKAEILAECQDISEVTVKRTLAKLIKENKVIKISGGRYTSYTWNRENE